MFNKEVIDVNIAREWIKGHPLYKTFYSDNIFSLFNRFYILKDFDIIEGNDNEVPKELLKRKKNYYTEAFYVLNQNDQSFTITVTLHHINSYRNYVKIYFEAKSCSIPAMLLKQPSLIKDYSFLCIRGFLEYAVAHYYGLIDEKFSYSPWLLSIKRRIFNDEVPYNLTELDYYTINNFGETETEDE